MSRHGESSSLWGWTVALAPALDALTDHEEEVVIDRKYVNDDDDDDDGGDDDDGDDGGDDGCDDDANGEPTKCSRCLTIWGSVKVVRHQGKRGLKVKLWLKLSLS